jgi:hypothetical protein
MMTVFSEKEPESMGSTGSSGWEVNLTGFGAGKSYMVSRMPGRSVWLGGWQVVDSTACINVTVLHKNP